MVGFEYLRERYGLIPSAMKAVRGTHLRFRWRNCLNSWSDLSAHWKSVVYLLALRLPTWHVANWGNSLVSVTTAGQYWIDGTGLEH